MVYITLVMTHDICSSNTAGEIHPSSDLAWVDAMDVNRSCGRTVSNQFARVYFVFPTFLHAYFSVQFCLGLVHFGSQCGNVLGQDLDRRSIRHGKRHPKFIDKSYHDTSEIENPEALNVVSHALIPRNLKLITLFPWTTAAAVVPWLGAPPSPPDGAVSPMLGRSDSRSEPASSWRLATGRRLAKFGLWKGFVWRTFDLWLTPQPGKIRCDSSLPS